MLSIINISLVTLSKKNDRPQVTLGLDVRPLSQQKGNFYPIKLQLMPSAIILPNHILVAQGTFGRHLTFSTVFRHKLFIDSATRSMKY